MELKQNLELYVERVQDPNPDLQRAALESMRLYFFTVFFLVFVFLNTPNSFLFFFVWSLRQEIRASTSSMTSVPKPLKFLRPHYGTLKAFHQTMPDSDLKVCHDVIIHFTFFLPISRYGFKHYFFFLCVSEILIRYPICLGPYHVCGG